MTSSLIEIGVSGHYAGETRELLARLPERCVQTCITSPPYWGLRSYFEPGDPRHAQQIGLEVTPELYVAAIVDVFRSVRRVLRDDGTLWVNLGDSYAGSRSGPQGASGEMADREVAKHRGMRSKTKGIDPKNPRVGARDNDAPNRVRQDGLKHKDLVGIPWMVAFALRADGWYLRRDIIWHKPNPMPESVSDRPTTSHEYLFLLSKSEIYYYDNKASSERAKGDHRRNLRPVYDSQVPGAPAHRGIRSQQIGNQTRNLRSVWTVASQPYAGAHFATFPPKLIEPCVLSGSRPGDIVLDPFFGSGTTGQVAETHGRRWIGFDLGYEDLAKERTAQRSLRPIP